MVHNVAKAKVRKERVIGVPAGGLGSSIAKVKKIGDSRHGFTPVKIVYLIVM
jgi:hypothetical protein